MPSSPDNEQSSNSHLATLVAINIVTQVLDEAEEILNTAHDSGQPWHYVWRQKNTNGEFYENAEILGMPDVKVNNDINNCENSQNVDLMVTSTPQKDKDNITKTYNNNSFIGQGDEDIQMRNSDLLSPSMLISCLFDMSDVEQAGTVEDLEDVQIEQSDVVVHREPSRKFLASTVAKLVESYVNLALNTVCGEVIIPEHEVMARSIEGSSNSSYSLLSDALGSGYTEQKNATFYIDNLKSEQDKDQYVTKMDADEDLNEVVKNEIDLYEKTFLTLNRDYDKDSEEEDIVPDGKCFIMQEVDLVTKKSSENLAPLMELSNISTVKTKPSKDVEGNKHSLVKRCRLQGAKLLFRLRSWWWKQRLVGKRKGCRSGSCTLSAQTRNLTASLLDHRTLRSPSPMRATAWKFNTVNEALIQSYNVKEFELEMNSSDPVEKD